MLTVKTESLISTVVQIFSEIFYRFITSESF